MAVEISTIGSSFVNCFKIIVVKKFYKGKNINTVPTKSF